MSTTEQLSPASSQRRVVAALREARSRLNLTQKEVSEALDWSISKLIRIENGQVGLSVTDLKAILLHYGITDRDRVETYVQMVKASKQPAWWDVYRKTNTPDFVKFLGLESDAVVVRQYQLNLIPGLLQIPEYTRVLVENHGGDQELTTRLVEMRGARQKRLAEAELKHFFVLEESVLHRQISDLDNWRTQLRHLRTVAEQPNVTIQVLPFTAGWICGITGSFELLQLSDDYNDLFLNLEFSDEDIFFDDVVGAEKAAKFLKYFHRLEATALPADQTPQVIEKVLKNLKN